MEYLGCYEILMDPSGSKIHLDFKVDVLENDMKTKNKYKLLVLENDWFFFRLALITSAT